MSSETDSSGNECPPESGSYEVGYRKPPVSTRFQVGQLGNRKGRKKKEKWDLRSEFESISNEVLPNSRGETLNERAIKADIAEALKGNTKHARRVFNRAMKHGFVEKYLKQSLIDIVKPRGEWGAIVGLHEQRRAGELDHE